MKSLEQNERETARWVALNALYNGAGYPLAERVILSVLEAVPIRSTAADVRQHLHFLETAGLARIDKHPDGTWTACITKQGIDCVEYNIPTPAGIARPHKYW